MTRDELIAALGEIGKNCEIVVKIRSNEPDDDGNHFYTTHPVTGVGDGGSGRAAIWIGGEI